MVDKRITSRTTKVKSKDKAPRLQKGSVYWPTREEDLGDLEGALQDYFDQKEKEKESPLDIQVGGDHYKTKKIQPIEYILANKLNYCEGAIIKYITRHRDKNGKEDLEKIKHYVDFLIKDEYE